MGSVEMAYLALFGAVLGYCYFLHRLMKIQADTANRHKEALISELDSLKKLCSDYQKVVLSLQAGKNELPSDWIKYIDSIPNHETYKKLDEYAFALVRFPGHEELFNQFTGFVKQSWKKLSLEQKGSILQSLETLTRKFYENCSHATYRGRDDVFQWLQTLMQEYKDAVHHQRIEFNTSIIQKYQSYIEVCKHRLGKIDDTELKELQRLEALIDKNLITTLQHKAMNDLLNKANQDVVFVLKEDARIKNDQESEKIKNYNKKILDDVQKAMNMIKEDKRPTTIANAADLIGAIDESRMMQPVAVYKNAIFSEIFKELGNSERRERFVRQMVSYSKAS